TMEDRYAKSIRYDIEKAQRKGLRCATGSVVAPLVRLCREQGYYPSALLDKLPELWNAIAARDIGKLLYVYDPSGETVCGALFLQDGDTFTYLMASTASGFKNSGANSLLLSEALRIAQQQAGLQLFDFEGSMVESIEHYFRGFGAKPRVYYNIQRNDLPLIHRLAYLAKQRLVQEHSIKSPQ
ncbi:MAG: GNAT family N-acetyltransferase, partial [Bacteroidota bacterium]